MEDSKDELNQQIGYRGYFETLPGSVVDFLVALLGLIFLLKSVLFPLLKQSEDFFSEFFCLKNSS